MKFLSNKIIALFASVTILFFVGLFSVATFCKDYDFRSVHKSVCDTPNLISEIIPDSVLIVTLVLGVLLLPSLLTLPLKSSVFEAWKRFAIWAIPTILLLVLWIESVGSAGGLPGQFHPGQLFYPLIAVIYMTSALVIILVGWQKTRKNLPFTASSLYKIGVYTAAILVGLLFVLYFIFVTL